MQYGISMIGGNVRSYSLTKSRYVCLLDSMKSIQADRDKSDLNTEQSL